MTDSVKVHDYRSHRRSWGHDYTFSPRNGGHEASMKGWGYGLRAGDLILLSNPKSSNDMAVYEISFVRYFGDPGDMWSAEVTWLPGKEMNQSQLDAVTKLVKGSHGN